MILRMLAYLWDASDRRLRSISKAEAKWVVRLAMAVPYFTSADDSLSLSPAQRLGGLWTWSTRYAQREAAGRDSSELDQRLAVQSYPMRTELDDAR